MQLADNKKTIYGRRKRTVFVGLSGGVDSSVSAALLRDQGYCVIGVHLRCWNVDGCAEQDAEDARRAAETLNIPFYVFDFEKEYKAKVVKYMVDGYKQGITPNPDVMCNQEIKFGLFYKRAMEMGADYVATGHYVRRVRRKFPISNFQFSNKKGELYSLFEAKDTTKDQSYFLWTLTQEQLAHCLFPIGNLIKRTEVRRLAKKYKLPNAEKKDSQGICFLGHVTLDEFLADFLPAKRGKILSTTGKILGKHKGAQFYTIGQRRGVGVSGSAEPMYVAEKDIRKNMLVVAKESDPALYKKEIALTDVNFISPQLQHLNIDKNVQMSVWCRVRYRQPLFRAKLEKLQSTNSKVQKWRLVFTKPQKFVAPGQSAVLYSVRNLPAGRQMLGGGIIKEAISLPASDGAKGDQG